MHKKLEQLAIDNLIQFNTQHGPLNRLPRILWNGGQPAEGGNNGGGNNTGGSNSGGQGGAGGNNNGGAGDRDQGFRAALDRMNGDATRLADRLYSENYQQREEIRTLRGQVPPQGGTALTPEQAALWQAYQSLGAPDEIRAGLTERDTLRSENTTFQRTRTIGQVAEIQGWKPAEFETFLEGKNLDFVIREDDKDKSKKVVFVKHKDNDKDVETPLGEYSKRWGALVEAFGGAQKTIVTGGAGSSGSGKGGGTGSASDFLSKKYGKKDK
ncbi:hypothetical protein [Deinococcus misasensis]|uniref:hypothetical protein n=1 Tax=Deinococcus misasensis TaxID=392413 RepID=UPI000551D02F|nr:hypothetical protein [Deinococcus misasensis]